MWLSTILAFTCGLLRIVASENETDQQRLVNTVFKNYNKRLRPVANTADVTNVTLNPGLFSIVQTEEANESITILLWFRMIWTDIFLKWNPSDFGEMNYMRIPISEIWYPDILVNNVKSIEILIPDEKNYAMIENDGTIEISILQLVTFHCKYDIIMFPFDIQNCSTLVGSWMHTANEIDVWFKTPTDLTSYNNNSEWDLISMTARRSLIVFGAFETAYVTVNYDLLIQRKPSYYLFTFVLPCFIITTISILGVFSPFNDAGGREEKVSLALTTLLTMTVLVTLIAAQMPKSSAGLPLLGIFVMLQIAIAAATALFAVLVMYQNRKWTFGEPIPVWILKLTGLYYKKVIPAAMDSNHSLSLYHKGNNLSAINAKRRFCARQAETEVAEATATINPCISDLANVIKQQTMIIKQLVEHCYDQRDEEHLRKDWQIASQRLDLLLMILFLILSCLLTGGFFIIGYANQRI